MEAGQLIAQRYRLERELGAGGMGVVWCARHIHTDKRVAVKCLHAQVATSSDVRQRFMREARVSARIDHPHIVDVLDAGELDDGSLYLVMELLEGMPLADAIRATPPLPLADFLVVVADVARALAAAHAVGVVHRDIKPENIFLHKERGSSLSHGKILDFGISKLTGNVDGVATTTGSLLGSPRFMSPEQVVGTVQLDGRTDLWAIGVMLFYALSGGWPHQADNFTGLCIQIGTQPPGDIDRLAPHAPIALRQIIKRLLVPAAQRIADGNQLADALEVVAADPAIASLTVSPRLQDPAKHITSEQLKVRTPSVIRRAPEIQAQIAGAQIAGAHGQGAPHPPAQPHAQHTAIAQQPYAHAQHTPMPQQPHAHAPSGHTPMPQQPHAHASSGHTPMPQQPHAHASSGHTPMPQQPHAHGSSGYGSVPPQQPGAGYPPPPTAAMPGLPGHSGHAAAEPNATVVGEPLMASSSTLSQVSPVSRPATQKSGNGALLGIGALVVVLGAAAAGIWVWQGQQVQSGGADEAPAATGQAEPPTATATNAAATPSGTAAASATATTSSNADPSGSAQPSASSSAPPLANTSKTVPGPLHGMPTAPRPNPGPKPGVVGEDLGSGL